MHSSVEADQSVMISRTKCGVCDRDEEELLYNKEKLLANGDKWEPELSAIARADAPYR